MNMKTRPTAMLSIATYKAMAGIILFPTFLHTTLEKAEVLPHSCVFFVLEEALPEVSDVLTVKARGVTSFAEVTRPTLRGRAHTNISNCGGMPFACKGKGVTPTCSFITDVIREVSYLATLSTFTRRHGNTAVSQSFFTLAVSRLAGKNPLTVCNMVGHTTGFVMLLPTHTGLSNFTVRDLTHNHHTGRSPAMVVYVSTNTERNKAHFMDGH